VTDAAWREPQLFDPPTFFAAHPETVVSPEIWARLEPRIESWARFWERRFDRQEEVRAALTLRVIEAATGFRRCDPETERADP
jgi:hypothetical protein